MTQKSRWDTLPTIEPPTLEQIEELRRQAEWDERVKSILPNLIKEYEDDVAKVLSGNHKTKP